MILQLLYEELVALNTAAERILSAGEGHVLAPPESLAELEARLPLEGDISIATLREQRRLLEAVEVLLRHLKARMDGFVLEQHVGAEDSVNAFFDYGNVLAARTKLIRIGGEMEALVEVITGEPPADDTTVRFPD